LNFSCNATDRNLTSITFYHNISGTWEPNQTVGITGNFSEVEFELINISQGNYIWNCNATDEFNNSGFATTNRTLSIDLSAPLWNPPLENQTVDYLTDFTYDVMAGTPARQGLHNSTI